MLHLDQNHASLSPPHSKSNLILSGSPRSDQHPVLSSSWSPSGARDDRPFYQPQQGESQPGGTPAPETHAVNEAVDSQHARQSASLGPSSPGHAEETKLSDPPASTSPTDATEPTSPLTPPPDNTSPAFPSTDLPEGELPTTTTAGGTEGEAEVKVEGSAEVDKASRASTPLSELSSAPDAEDPLDDEKKTGESETAGDASKDAEGTKPDTHNTDGSSRPTEAGKPAVNGLAEASHIQPMPAMATSIVKTESTGSRAPSLGIATPEPSLGLSQSSQKLDPKVMTVLELNAELLKACMEFQTRGVPMSEPRAQQYFSRLQNNLGWLAAAADSKPNHQVHPLPQMQPPPPVDFLPTERILALYTELPVIFAKDLRRRSMSAGGPGSANVNISNGALKRERHEDFVGESVSAHKRQHTGESRGPSLAPSPQNAPSPAQSISSSMIPPATPPGSMPPPSLPGPSVSSPSMLPPAMPMGMHNNQQDVQLLARERARQAQARHLSMGGQTNMGNDGMRQMSPGSHQGMSNTAGPSNMANMANNPQAQMAALNQMGPMGLQVMHALQNPSHQVTQYLNNSVPNFSSLPMQQQMSQFMRVQQAMQARRQQAAQAAQSGSMGGMPQGGGAQGTMGGNMVGGPMGLSNDSPTRISPTGHQFPSGNTSGGMNPSNPMSGLTLAQQNNLNNLTNVQKQQLMMLQQQQMRSGNVNPNMLNPQALNVMQQQQQRMMQQMAGSTHIGSPMLGGTTDGGNFPPSLRSNPSVPGIARSTRTPSDHSQSPMTPQLSQMGGQRGISQLSQAGMGQMGGGSMNQWNQGSQMGHGQGYGMSPPNSAGGFGGGMSGGASSPMGNQQWNQGNQMMFPGGMGNQQLGDIGGLPISRQTSATPAPQQQLAQNSPMGDPTGMGDFDLFNWAQ